MYSTEVMREVLTEFGYKLNDRGLEWRCRPLYRDSNNETSLRITKSTGNWVDFAGRVGGSFHKLVQIHLGVTEDKAKEFLTSRNFYDGYSHMAVKPKLVMAKHYSEDLLEKLIKDNSYWVNRGIRKETLSLLKGGVGATGKMYNRYVFPIFNKAGLIMGFSGRDLKDLPQEERNKTGRPKWKHLGEKKYFDYPLYFIEEDIEKEGDVILVESIGDFLSLYEAGVKNVLVLFGVTLQPELLAALIRLDPKHIVIATNNEPDNKSIGNRAAAAIEKKLWKYFDQSQIIVNLPPSKDFGEMTKEEILEWKEQMYEFA